MIVRKLGDTSVAAAREQDLAEEIARVTKLAPRSVRRRLGAIHGKTRVRAAFRSEWPSDLDELALTPASDAGNPGFAELVAGVTGLSERAVLERLKRADAAALTREVFAKEWLDVSRASPAEVGAVSVQEATALGFAPRIAAITGLEERFVSRRMRAANGRTRVDNLFADLWPSAAPAPAAAEPRPAAPRVASSRAGLVGSRYELLERLGEGGFGEAWRARDTTAPGKPERVLKFARAGDAESRASLEREMQKASDLTHPHICKLYDWNEDAARGGFLVYAYGGLSLGQTIANEGCFAIDRALGIVEQIAGALDFAHSRGVIHHDVSPGNILIGGDGVARLTDFGVSKSASALRTTGGAQSAVATSTSVAFNRVYVAPEILLYGEALFASDQYMLALVLCSMLEGKVLDKPYAPREQPALSPAQNAALARALSIEPKLRFPSCSLFARALSSSQGSGS